MKLERTRTATVFERTQKILYREFCDCGVSVRESPEGDRAPRTILSDLNSGSVLSGRPVVWQKLGDPGNRMGGNTGENIFEPGEGTDFGPLAGSHKALQHCGGVAALVAAKECPIVAVMYT